MKLPVSPKDSWEVIDKDGNHLCFAPTTEQRDYIVTAINSHKKLVEALKRYGDHEPCCMKGDGCTCGLAQALKESDKE